LRAEEVRLAEQLVESLTSRFKPEAYKDEFQARLKELIDAKLEGKTVAPTPKREKAPVIDMMEALKRSLGEGRRAAGGGKARPARAASAGGHRQHRKAS
jgi:DNA end-binding protein Ku